MSDTVKLYRTRVPGHNHVPPDTVAAFIADQVTVNSSAAWGDRFTLAMIYLAAHEIELTPGLGSVHARETAQIMMQRDGELQRQYAQTQNQNQGDLDEYLRLTLYGRRVLALMAGTGARIPIVSIPNELAQAGGITSIASETI